MTEVNRVMFDAAEASWFRDRVVAESSPCKSCRKGLGLVDLFAEDVAVACVPGELLDHHEQCPSHADRSFAGIVLGVVELEAGRDIA